MRRIRRAHLRLQQIARVRAQAAERRRALAREWRVFSGESVSDLCGSCGRSFEDHQAGGILGLLPICPKMGALS